MAPALAVYGHPDLAKIKTFLLDFGMTVVEETDESVPSLRPLSRCS